MDFDVGDIVLFQSEVAGKAKFHFCFFFDAGSDRYSFMFLNSENPYRDHFVIDDTRLPNMYPSRTGKTIFSCPTVIRKSPKQLARMKPKTICRLPLDVAEDFRRFADAISSMTANDKTRLIATLDFLIRNEID